MSLKVGFIGCVISSVAALETLLELGSTRVQLVGLLTRKTSTSNADFQDLSPFIESHGIPVLFADDVGDDASQAAWFRSLEPDVIFCVGWSRLLGLEVLSVAPRGVIGYHPAALPANRGRHPLIWSLVLGLEETASSFFLMDSSADSGGLVSQIPVKIEDSDDAASLYAKMLVAIKKQVVDVVDKLNKNRLEVVIQDHTKANYWRKRVATDGLIDWRMPAKNIQQLVKALVQPYPGAEFLYNGKPTKLWKCDVVRMSPQNIEPGKVLSLIGNKIVVKCGEDALCLIEHELFSLPKEGDYL